MKNERLLISHIQAPTDKVYIVLLCYNVMMQIRANMFKTSEGIMAQCQDNPEIIVTGKSKTEIKSQLKILINCYVQAFPNTKNKFFTKDNKMAEINLEFKPVKKSIEAKLASF